MKLAIVSDIHDNVWTLQAALAGMQDAEQLICCGDLCSPFVVALIAERFHGPIHIVEGNNEGDWRRMTQLAGNYSNVFLHGEFFQEIFDGKRVAVNHYTDIALPIAQSGRYDVVCCGHNHRFAIEQHGDTLMLNPGALLGYDPVARRDIPATFMLYETTSNAARGYQVPMKRTADETSPIPYP
jgi:putative phosphoesterase